MTTTQKYTGPADLHRKMREQSLSPLAIRVEAYLTASRVDPVQFGLDVCKERHLVRDLRNGRKLGEVLEAKVMLYLSSKGFKHPPTDGVLTPSLQSIAEHDKMVCGRIRVEASNRRMEISDLLCQLVVIGWSIYAAERGLD